MKVRHKIEYDDGDYEWIDLRKESDRVQVYLPDGSWVMVRNLTLTFNLTFSYV